MEILCPVCRKRLYPKLNSYVCENRHNFDLAKEGYLNLSRHASDNTGDNPDMIKARRAFLEKGYYSFLRDEVNSLLNQDDSLIDLACGEGYYTSAFICKDKIGIDLSKSGLKYASRKDKTSFYLLNSIFHNPLPDACADKIVTIFAPIAEKEILRLLKKDGIFILVKPDKQHLYQLKQAVYEHPYYNQIEEIKIDGLKLIKEIPIQKTMNVTKEDLLHLFQMTPYVNTTSSDDKEKLYHIDDLDITFAFLIDIYQKL